jgi:hypothetical protein
MQLPPAENNARPALGNQANIDCINAELGAAQRMMWSATGRLKALILKGSDGTEVGGKTRREAVGEEGAQ